MGAALLLGDCGFIVKSVPMGAAYGVPVFQDVFCGAELVRAEAGPCQFLLPSGWHCSLDPLPALWPHDPGGQHSPHLKDDPRTHAYLGPLVCSADPAHTPIDPEALPEPRS